MELRLNGILLSPPWRSFSRRCETLEAKGRSFRDVESLERNDEASNSRISREPFRSIAFDRSPYPSVVLPSPEGSKRARTGGTRRTARSAWGVGRVLKFGNFANCRVGCRRAQQHQVTTSDLALSNDDECDNQVLPAYPPRSSSSAPVIPRDNLSNESGKGAIKSKAIEKGSTRLSSAFHHARSRAKARVKGHGAPGTGMKGFKGETTCGKGSELAIFFRPREPAAEEGKERKKGRGTPSAHRPE